MPKLAIFDIDGTLINSSEVDERCFVQAAEESLGIRNIDTRWENYKHATDGGIFEELFEKQFGRKPAAEEVKKQITTFVSLLGESYQRNPLLFQEVDGAGKMLRMLSRHPQWKATIATGTWREAAFFKLKAAALDVAGIPLTTSSDAHSREEIIQKSISAAKEFYRVDEFEKIVSVGDAVWDMRAAKKLGIAFIMIAKSAAITGSGPKRVLENFNEPERFLKYIDGVSP